MSHLPDMQTLESGYVAVGWLHPDHSYSQGDPAPEFLARLKESAQEKPRKGVGFHFFTEN